MRTMNFQEVGHLLDPSVERSLPRLNLSVQSVPIVSLPGFDLEPSLCSS